MLGERVREDLRLANLFAPQVRYATELWSRPIVDLTVSIDNIFTNLRKSYKSQINWGKKNLHNEYLSGDQLTDAKIVELYDLLHRLNEDVHSKYGNGMTKELFLFPLLSCRRGEGEVTLTRDQDQIIGLTVTTDLNQVTYYALGAYIKSGNKSAAHFMLFDAIERAQKRGNTEFALNRAFGSPESLNQSANVRNRNIIFFKSGFANQTKYTLAYQVKVPSIPLNA